MRLIHGLVAFFWMVNTGLMLHYDSKSEDAKSDWNQTIDTQSENGSQFELINVYNDSDWIPIESTEQQCGCQFHPMTSGDFIITTLLPDLNELMTTELPKVNESDGNDDLKSSSSTTNEKAKLTNKIVISDGKDKNNGVNIDGAIPGGTTVESDKDVEFVPSTVVHITVDSVDSNGELEDETSTTTGKDGLSTKSNLPTDDPVNLPATTEAVDVTKLVNSEKPEETSISVAIDSEDSLQTDSSNPKSTMIPPVGSNESTVNEDDLKTNEPEPDLTSESLTTSKPEINVDSNSRESTTKYPQIEPSTIVIISPDFNESTNEVSDATVAETTSSPVDKEISSESITTFTESQGEGGYESTVTEESKVITASTVDKSESTSKNYEDAETKTTTTKTSDIEISTTDSSTKIMEVSETEQTTAKNDNSNDESVTTEISSTQSVGSSTGGSTVDTSQESTQGSEVTTASTGLPSEETSADSNTSTQASDESSSTIPFTSTDLSSRLPSGSTVDPSTVDTTVLTESSESPSPNYENPSTELTSESTTNPVTESSSDSISESSSGLPESSSLSPTSTQNPEGSSSQSSETATTSGLTVTSAIPTNSEEYTTDAATIVPSTFQSSTEPDASTSSSVSTEIEETTTTSSMTTIASSSPPTITTETTNAINTSESVTTSGVTMNVTTMITPTRVTPNVTDIPKPSVKPPINQCIQFPSLKTWRYDLLRRVAQAFYLIVKRRLNLPPESPLRKSAIFFRSIRYLRRMNWSLTRTPLWAIYNARTQIIRMVKCEQSFNMFGSKVLVGIWKARLCCFNRLLIQCGTTTN